jgi:hypothetical protein
MFTMRVLSLVLILGSLASEARAQVNVNILLEGQSNAAYFRILGGADILKTRLEDALGFHDPGHTVTILGRLNTTIWGATSLVPSNAAAPDTAWLSGDAATGWKDGAMQRSVVATLAQLPPHLRASPTVTVWLHNESDSANGALTQASWESAIRHCIDEQRAALRQTPATTPVDFVFVPFDFDPGRLERNGKSNKVQALAASFEHLAADPSFNAVVAAQIGDSDMDGTDPFKGGMHMNRDDVAQLADRLARTIGNQLWRDAVPGSPEARAQGKIPAFGPAVAAVSRNRTRQLEVSVVLDRGTHGLQPLSPAAADGAGWSIVDGGKVDYAQSARMQDGKIVLSFPAGVPASGTARLYYGWGTGRIYPHHKSPGAAIRATSAATSGASMSATMGASGGSMPGGGEKPGHGAAIYDDNGLPLRVPADGLPVPRDVQRHMRAPT